MKAQDAANAINKHITNSIPWEQEVIVVCYRLLEEVEDIAVARNAESNRALLSIFKQQQQTWEAITRKVRGLEGLESHWKKFIQDKIPALHEELRRSGQW